MLPTPNASNVLLPYWILKQESSLSDHDFTAIVVDYLTRYEGYELIEVKNPFAVCDRPIIERQQGKRRQGKGRIK